MNQKKTKGRKKKKQETQEVAPTDKIQTAVGPRVANLKLKNPTDRFNSKLNPPEILKRLDDIEQRLNALEKKIVVE